MVLEKVMQMKSKHLICGAKNVMQTKSERLIHDEKEKFEYPNPRKQRRSLNALSKMKRAKAKFERLKY